MNEYELRSLLVAVAVSWVTPTHYLLADLRHTVIDDVLVHFIHDAQRDPGRLVLHFGMGELSEHEPLLALLGLMHLNLLSGSKTTGVFALDAAASRLIYALHFFEPHRSPATAMANALHEHAQKAKALLHAFSDSREDVEAIRERRRRLDLGLIQRIHPRAWHAMAQPVAHPRQLLRRALKQRFDRAVPAVADPAGDAVRPRVPHAAVAEADALDDAAHPHQAVLDQRVVVVGLHAFPSLIPGGPLSTCFR